MAWEWRKQLISAQLPWGELFKESGSTFAEGCKIIAKKVSDLLRESTRSPKEGEKSGEGNANYETLSGYLNLLLIHCEQLFSEDAELPEEIAKVVIEDVVDSYLGYASAAVTTTAVNATGRVYSCNSAIWSIVAILLQNTVSSSCGLRILEIFQKHLEKLCHDNSDSTANASNIISIIAHAIKKADPISIESNIFSMSDLFEEVLSLLKEVELKVCQLLSSMLLPLLIASEPSARTARVWKFVQDVHSQSLCVTCLGSDLILTIFCCLSDVFLHNTSSPFTILCQFPARNSSRSEPVFDLREEDEFWEIVQDGLVSDDPLARKQSMYLVRSVLESVERSSVGSVASAGRVFWWDKDCEKQLRKAWDDLVLVLETMEEKQIHIVKPVRGNLKRVITAAATKSKNGHYVLHLSWQFVALSRVFQHTEAKSVIRWGVLDCLQMNLEQSPLLLKGNWKFIFQHILKVLNTSVLYAKGQCEELEKVLASFFKRIVAGLNEENRGDFLRCLFAAIDSDNFTDVPLVFLTYSLSQLPQEPLIGPETLAYIRSIIFNGILTHKPYFRAAAQHFLLMAVTNLSNSEVLSYDDIVRTLGSFRESECLIVGTEAWKRAYTFFARFCQEKNKSDPKSAVGDYFKCCLSSYFTLSQKEQDQDRPIPVHLVRAIFLLAQGEHVGVKDGPRILSSTCQKDVAEWLAVLLDKVLETASMAGQRPYLPQEHIATSLEMILAIVRLVLHGKKDSRDKEGQSNLAKSASLIDGVLKDYLPNILHFVVDQLFMGSKENGRPCLDHVTFYVEVLESLYQFQESCGRPALTTEYHAPETVATRAAKILITIIPVSHEPVLLSAELLGAMTALKWACRHLVQAHLRSQSNGPHLFVPLQKNDPPTPAPISFIQSFPVSLNLKRKLPEPPKQTLRPDSSQDATHSFAREEWDWGPLVSHCSQAYWECLLTFLRYSSSSDVEPSRRLNQESKTHVHIGCEDATLVMVSCLSALDSAGSSVGVIIKAVSSLVPKLLKTEEGRDHLLSAMPSMWSYVMELKSNQAPFWKALQAFVGVVFHPLLLLQHSIDSSIIQTQELTVEDLVALGEAKLGTFNIMVEHVLGVLKDSLASLKTDPSSSVSAETFFRSLHIQCGLLLKMATFGPVHKKNLRNVEEVELFLDNLDQEIYLNHNLTRCAELDANVRIRLTMFIVQMGEWCVHEVSLYAHFCKFISTFSEHLLLQLEEATDSRKHYYLNSATHRVKLRLSQTLLVIVDHMSEDTGTIVVEKLLQLLQSDNQLSVRYLLEWVVVKLLTKYPAHLGKIYKLAEKESGLRLSRLCSVFTIARHVGPALPEETKVKHYLQVLPVLLCWSGSFHFVARLYAQAALVQMWEDCTREPSLLPVLQTLDYLKPHINFIKTNGDFNKFNYKIKSNVFLSLIDTTRDWNYETIFYILPLLCDVSLEEVTPPSSFQVFLTSRHSLLLKPSSPPSMDLWSNNSDLKMALKDHLSIPPGRDGTDTRSIACQITSDKPTEGNGGSSTCPPPDHDVQKKITLLSNPSTILHELFPHSDHLASLVTSLSGSGNGSTSNNVVPPQQEKSGLVVAASLLSKIPNLGGICRTGEIFGIQTLVINDKKVIEENEFQRLSVTAEKWMDIQEVKLSELRVYLTMMKEEGYSIVGLEQTLRSRNLSSYKFQHKTVLVLGNEREGIPPSIIYMLDHCIEIPQYGTIRSLNVHVSAALVISEYSKQFFERH